MSKLVVFLFFAVLSATSVFGQTPFDSIYDPRCIQVGQQLDITGDPVFDAKKGVTKPLYGYSFVFKYMVGYQDSKSLPDYRRTLRLDPNPILKVNIQPPNNGNPTIVDLQGKVTVTPISDPKDGDYLLVAVDVPSNFIRYWLLFDGTFEPLVPNSGLKTRTGKVVEEVKNTKAIIQPSNPPSGSTLSANGNAVAPPVDPSLSVTRGGLVPRGTTTN